MSDTLKKIITHGAAAAGGFWFGSRGSTPGERSKNIFSRFIPTLIIAYGITHFAINTPSEFFGYLKQVNQNSAEVQKLEIEKKVDIYDNKISKLDDTQKQFENYLNTEKKNQSTIDNTQNKKIGGIEKKINEIRSEVKGSGLISSASSGTNAFNTYVAFDKSDQRFYFYKDHKMVKSGPMIFNGSGKPANGLYDVKDAKQLSGDLYPGFITLDGVVGISGAGQSNHYAPSIINSNNVTRSGFRVSNSDMDYLMSNVVIGTKIEVRN